MQPNLSVGPERIPALDALRGVAALLIVLFHFRHFDPWFDLPWMGGTGLLQLNYLWVDLFFVLSGYLLAHVYGDRFRNGRPSWRRSGEFWWARVARIYPLHLSALVLIALMGAAGMAAEGSRSDGRCYGTDELVASILLIHAWGVTEGLCWNVPSWSLSAEAAAYILFPVLFPLIHRFPWRWSFLLPLAALGLLAVLAEGLGGGRLSLHYDYGFARCLPSFALGIWLRRLAEERPGWLVPIGTDTGCVLITTLLALLMHNHAHDGVIVGAMALLVAALSANRRLGVRVCGSRAGVWLGEVSYAVYLLHWPLLLAFTAMLTRFSDGQPGPDGRVQQVLLYAVFFTVLLAVSTLTYHVVEVTSRRWLRGLVFPRPEHGPDHLKVHATRKARSGGRVRGPGG